MSELFYENQPQYDEDFTTRFYALAAAKRWNAVIAEGESHLRCFRKFVPDVDQFSSRYFDQQGRMILPEGSSTTWSREERHFYGMHVNFHYIAQTIATANLETGNYDAALENFKLFAALAWQSGRRMNLQTGDSTHPESRIYDYDYEELDVSAMPMMVGLTLNLHDMKADGLNILEPYRPVLQRFLKSDDAVNAYLGAAVLAAMDGNSDEATRLMTEYTRRQTVDSEFRAKGRGTGVYRDHTADLLTAVFSRNFNQVADALKGSHSAPSFVRTATRGWAFQTVLPSSGTGRMASNRIMGTELIHACQLAPRWHSNLTNVGLEHTLSLRSIKDYSIGTFANRARSSEAPSKLGVASACCYLTFPDAAILDLQQSSDWLIGNAASDEQTAENTRESNEQIEHSENSPNAESLDYKKLLKPLPWIETSQIQQKIAPRQAVFEIVKCRTFDMENIESGFAFTPMLYGGWLIRNEGEPIYVDIGPASEIDRSIHLVRNLIAKGPQATRDDGDELAQSELQKPLAELTNRLLGPLRNALADIDNLIICPDGELWLLPWAALPISDGTSLLEHCTLSLRFTSAELLRDNDRITTKTLGPPAIFAAPDFDATPPQVMEKERVLLGAVQHDVLIAKTTDGRRLLPPVRPLPGTEVEAAVVEPLLKSFSTEPPKVFKGVNALESIVQNTKRPEYLIFQTHGFFLEDPNAPPSHPASTAAPEVREDKMASASHPVFLRTVANGSIVESPAGYSRLDLSRPFARCGLLLAGCNSNDQWGEARSADGILTATEVSMMDLRGTKAVVLSACDTGVGEASVGEGVAGLRQAFQMAGAESVIATLWQIPDRESAILMSDFFANLAKGQSSAEALRNAQIKSMESRRKRFGAAHPFYWAAWTLTGR